MIAYTIAGQEFIVKARLSRERAGWLRGWEISRWDGILGVVKAASSYADTARIAAAEVQTSPSFDYPTEEYWALPGSYAVEVEDDHLLYEPGDPQQITVTGHLPMLDGYTTAHSAEITEVEISEFDMRPTIAADIDEQISEHITECSESRDIFAFGACSLAVEREVYYSVSDVEWTIIEEPETQVVLERDGDLGRPEILVETVTPGTAEAEITHTVVSEEDRTETIEFSVRGRVEARDGEVVFLPRR